MQLVEEPLAVGRIGHDDVSAHRLAARRERPHVQVVDTQDAGDLEHRRLDPAQLEVSGRPFEQDVDGLAEEPPRARDDEERDGRAHQRIDGGPARERHRGGGEEHAARGERVAQHFQIGGSDVETGRGATVEQPRRDQVDAEARRGDGHHRPAEHLGRRQHALVGLDQDHEGHGQEQQRVDDGGQDLDAVVAERLLGRGRPGGNPDGEQRQADARHVGEHVAGVGGEGQAARPHRTQDLDDQKAAREHEHDQQMPPRTVRRGLSVDVRHGANRIKFL